MVPLRFASAKQTFLVTLVGCLALASLGLQASNTVASNVNCPDYLVIDSRGSSRPEGEVSPSGTAFINAVRAQHPDSEVRVANNPYQALGGWGVQIGAILKLPLGYHQSVVLGKRWLKSKIGATANQCPNTKQILVGYSQGAHISADVFQDGVPDQVIGVVIFGDPYFNSLDQAVDKGDFSKGLNGNLGSRPFFDRKNGVVIASYCHNHDQVCQGPLSFFGLLWYRFSRHNNYGDLGEPEKAASLFNRTDGKVAPSPPKPANKWPTEKNDLSIGVSLLLGANTLGFAGWMSCSRSYCLAGSGSTVYVFSISNGTKQLGSFQASDDPRGDLKKIGFSEEEIQELLSP